MTDMAIRLTDVDRVFATETEIRALQHVSLQIATGTVSTVVGPSGSGKTTLLNTIAGLDRATSGSTEVLGQHLDRLNDDTITLWRRRNVAFIFQAKGLVSHLTAFENVELALRLNGTARAERRGLAEDMLDRVGLASFLDHRPGELSGGQQQRVAIARALVWDAPLLIADEPTGELDSDTAAEMIELLLERVAVSSTTALIATHDAVLEQAADRVLRLVDGRLVDEQTTDVQVSP